MTQKKKNSAKKREWKKESYEKVKQEQYMKKIKNKKEKRWEKKVEKAEHWRSLKINWKPFQLTHSVPQSTFRQGKKKTFEKIKCHQCGKFGQWLSNHIWSFKLKVESTLLTAAISYISFVRCTLWLDFFKKKKKESKIEINLLIWLWTTLYGLIILPQVAYIK